MRSARLAMLLAAGTMLLGLQGCEIALLGAAAGGAVTAFEDRRSTGTQVDDEAIELRTSNRVAERFGTEKVHINVNAYNRWALLTGEVPDDAARSEIDKIVAGIANVRGVTNEIQIAPPTPMGSRANDSFITSKVKARFLDARRLNPVHVKVATEAGVVYLMGLVTEKEAEDAVEIARTTGGVRKVVKIFEYCQPAEQVCRARDKAPSEPPARKPAP